MQKYTKTLSEMWFFFAFFYVCSVSGLFVFWITAKLTTFFQRTQNLLIRWNTRISTYCVFLARYIFPLQTPLTLSECVWLSVTHRESRPRLSRLAYNRVMQGNFTPAWPQNRTWKSPFIRLFMLKSREMNVYFWPN